MDGPTLAPLSSSGVGRRTTAVLLLGVSSGLPLAMSGDLLSAWLNDAGFDIARIGLFGLVGLPYAFKFLWAPLLDRYVPPFLGRRRGWIAVAQALLTLAMGAMSLAGPRGGSALPLAAATTVVALLSATQDIVIDAWRTDVLPPAERGLGAAMFIAGYRLGMILSGAGALMLVGRFHLAWPTVLRLYAGLMSLGLIATWAAPEPADAAAPRSLREAVVRPLEEFVSRRQGWLVLLFVLLFKLPEFLANGVSLPFLLRAGFGKTEVGAVRQGLGVGITIVGCFLGGGVVARMGAWRSLWVFGLLHSVSNLAFLVLARAGPRHDLLLATIGIENLCVGMTTAGFAAWMMGQCDRRHTAFQFALLSGVMALSRVLSVPLAGWLAGRVGWAPFFAISAAFGLPGVLLLPLIRDDLPATKTLVAGI